MSTKSLKEIRKTLRGKQRAFAEYYVGEARFNGTKAAKMAGYSEKTATVIASENLSKPNIRGYIDKILEDRLLSGAEVLDRIRQIADADLGDLFDDDGNLDVKSAKEKGLLQFVKSYSISQRGERVVLYDKHEALRDLAKHYKLLTDRLEVASDPESPLIPDSVAELIGRAYANDEDTTDPDPDPPNDS